MTEHALSAIDTGIYVGIFGVLLKYVGVMDLLAGFDPREVAEEEVWPISPERMCSTLPF